MKPGDRRHDIVEMLVETGSASLDDLSRHFGVSKMTIHRDLDELEEEGLLRKVRGGATIEASGRFESDYRYRTRVGVEDKRRIAARAAELVEPGASVLVDDGSTSAHLAGSLAARRPLTVITNSHALIEGLTEAAGIEVIALGGAYSRRFNGFFGMLTLAALSNLRADVALVSSSAVEGCTAYHQDLEVLEVKRRMMAAAARSYLMVDPAKFGKTALHRMTDLTAFSGLVTTRAIGPEQSEKLAEQGIDLIFAKEQA